MNTSQYIGSLQPMLGELAALDLKQVESILLRAHDEERTIFIIGNGGSAATASHMANDLNKGASVSGRLRFRAIALTDNVPLITAWANDTHYERIFVEQMTNFLRAGDVVIAISGSGNSPNIIAAVEWARREGAITIGLTGGAGGRLRAVSDCCLIAPSSVMEQIEDMHLILSHALCVSLRAQIATESVLAAREL